MTDKQSKKGGGLMIVHKNTHAYTELEQVDTKQEDILILRGTLKSMKVTIILLYLSVIRGATERKSNQEIMTEIRRGISHCDDDELVFIMGDFNAHVGIIGEQELNYNGKIVLDIMTENNMIMLNDTDKCKVTYTWSRGQSNSVIDFVLVNSLAFGICDLMDIDEQQEQFDLTYHNLIEISLKLNYMDPNYDRRGRWEEKIYYKLDKKSLEKYITQMEKDLNTHNANISIEEFNKIVERAAEKTLMSKYKRRLLKNNQRKSEGPWVNDEIRNKIKKTK